MSIFFGSGVAVCTPFDTTGAFNGATYEKLIAFQVEQGTDAIVSCGTTGESSTLSKEEHLEVVKTAVGAVKKTGKDIPVIAGAGGNNTAECISMGQSLSKLGVSALMYVTPYYNKTSQRGLIEHYKKIASSVELPIMLYNVPVRTGMNMTAETLQELSSIENIVAIKETSSDISQVAEMIERCGDSIDVYSGNDDQILPFLSLGGKGVVSTLANIIPADIHNIVAKFAEGDLEGSRKLQLKILPLMRLMFADVNPMPIKAALNLLGYDMGYCRMPLTNVDGTLLYNLKKEMQVYGLI